MTKKRAMNYLSVRREVVSEESFEIVNRDKNLHANELEDGLAAGRLNLVQHAVVESLMLVVNSAGKVVATLQKDGCDGPNHQAQVRVF